MTRPIPTMPRRRVRDVALIAAGVSVTALAVDTLLSRFGVSR